MLSNPEPLQTEGPLDNAACRAYLMKAMGTIHMALHGVTVEQLCLRVRTGIDQLPQPASQEVTPPPGTARELPRKLENAALQGIKVYSMHENRLTLVTKQHELFAAPLAIFSDCAPDQFRIVFCDGRVRVYKIAAKSFALLFRHRATTYA